MKRILAALTALTIAFSPTAFAITDAAEKECKNISAIILVIAQQRDQGVTEKDLAATLKAAIPGIDEIFDTLTQTIYAPQNKAHTPEQLAQEFLDSCMKPA